MKIENVYVVVILYFRFNARWKVDTISTIDGFLKDDIEMMFLYGCIPLVHLIITIPASNAAYENIYYI